ncbi:MAG: hypothetical protein IT318_18350 [Anaerolineales bacterium]|nr:hypothetical protein [Anaerolineales bacterium]
MQPQPKPGGQARSPWTAAVLIVLLVLLLPIAGLAGGFALAWAEGHGAFVRWQRLPAPPSPAREILGGGTALSTGGWWLYILGADGKFYHCPPYESCWVEVAAVPEPRPVEPCEPPANFSVPALPGSAVDELQAQACHPEAAFQVNFALLSDGSVWKWQRMVSGLGSVVKLVLFLGCGTLLGMGAAGLMGVLAWRRQRAVRR